ncbi:MAG: hypothetical protein ABH833_02780 [Parcubacteria group bacterium]
MIFYIHIPKRFGTFSREKRRIMFIRSLNSKTTIKIVEALTPLVKSRVIEIGGGIGKLEDGAKDPEGYGDTFSVRVIEGRRKAIEALLKANLIEGIVCQ